MIQEQAIRVFFTLGGQPELVNPVQYTAPAYHHDTSFGRIAANQSLQFADSTVNPGSFEPLLASTPRRHEPVNSSAHTSVAGAVDPLPFNSASNPNFVSTEQLQLRPSPRHDALYTHFTRLVYFIWNKNVCQRRNNEVCTVTEKH